MVSLLSISWGVSVFPVCKLQEFDMGVDKLVQRCLCGFGVGVCTSDLRPVHFMQKYR